MRIVIDARMKSHGGIGTYLRGILPYMEESPHEVIELLPNKVNASIYTLKEQVELPRKIPSCDIFWSPHFNVPFFPVKAKRRIVTIHDLFHLDHLEQFSLSKRLYAKAILTKAVQSSDQVITVSEFSRERLLHHFPRAEEKTTVIHSGCDHLLKFISKPVEGLPESFFLFVGNLKPHKNLEVIFEALKRLPEVHLVIVGKRSGFIHGIDWNKLEKETKILKPRLHFLGKVSDAELSWLYKGAEALIFPSLYEGWGLPPLEAMSLGCPVIASTAASIPQACGVAASYFNPKSPQELLKKMQELPKTWKERVSLGRKRAGELSWKDSAEKHLQVFARDFSVLP